MSSEKKSENNNADVRRDEDENSILTNTFIKVFVADLRLQIMIFSYSIFLKSVETGVVDPKQPSTIHVKILAKLSSINEEVFTVEKYLIFDGENYNDRNYDLFLL